MPIVHKYSQIEKEVYHAGSLSANFVPALGRGTKTQRSSSLPSLFCGKGLQTSSGCNLGYLIKQRTW